MSTSVITTRTEPISDSGRTLLIVEFRRQRLRMVTTLFLCRDSVGCITATQLGPNNFQSQTKFGRCQDSEGDSRLDLGKRARARLADSGGQRSKTSPCEALLSTERPPASKTRRRLVLMNHSDFATVVRARIRSAANHVCDNFPERFCERIRLWSKNSSSLPREGSFPDRRLMPLPAHST